MPDVEAQARGLLVIEAAIPNAGRYYPGHRVIVLRPDLDAVTRRCVLAHELAHHHYRDDCTSPSAERRAWRWAANRLIRVEQIVQCALEHPDHPELWCEQLHVTPHVLRTWLAQPRNYEAADTAYRRAA